jgi:hypothetical protein
MYNYVQEHPFTCAREIREVFNHRCTEQTIRNYLNEQQIFCRKPAKKIALTDEHRRQRVEFAQNHLNMNWDNVIFVDEKVFSSSSHSRKPLWRINGTRYDPNKVLHQTRSGRITCGYWGYITAAGPGELVEVSPRMNAVEYVQVLDHLHTCLQMTYGEDFPDEVWMVQDNSSVHTSRLVREWFEENPTYRLIPWPSKSPDLNPIENMWGISTREWEDIEEGINIRTRAGLDRHLRNIWDRQRGRNTCQNLINSMPKRLREVIDNDGWWTKY